MYYISWRGSTIYNVWWKKWFWVCRLVPFMMITMKNGTQDAERAMLLPWAKRAHSLRQCWYTNYSLFPCSEGTVLPQLRRGAVPMLHHSALSTDLVSIPETLGLASSSARTPRNHESDGSQLLPLSFCSSIVLLFCGVNSEYVFILFKKSRSVELGACVNFALWWHS